MVEEEPQVDRQRHQAALLGRQGQDCQGQAGQVPPPPGGGRRRQGGTGGVKAPVVSTAIGTGLGKRLTVFKVVFFFTIDLKRRST